MHFSKTSLGMLFFNHRTFGISISMLICPPTYLNRLCLVALIFLVSSTGRWSSQRMTLRSLPSRLSNLGPVTACGSSESSLKTAREQVASKPMPRTELGSMLCWDKARWTDWLMHRQMLVVDCS